MLKLNTTHYDAPKEHLVNPWEVAATLGSPAITCWVNLTSCST